MGLCEMCGKNTQLVSADVEGSLLNVCPVCAKYGIVQKKPSLRSASANSFSPSASFSSASGSSTSSSAKREFKVVDNYASLLRSARLAKGISQEDFAKLLNEKQSLVAKWEQGSLRLPIGAARKIGQQLGLHLLEEEKEIDTLETEGRRKLIAEPTLGDFIKVRKRK